MMFNSSGAFRLFTIRGVPIKADPLAFLLALMIGASSSEYLAAYGAVGTAGLSVLAGALALVSILWHESAHAIVARLQDIEVLGVTLTMFGGFTSMNVRERHSRKQFLVSLAGPASTLLLAGIFIGMSKLLANSPLGLTLFFLGSRNLWLAAFNMLPGYPFDGGSVLREGVAWVTKKPKYGDIATLWVGSATGLGMALWAASQFSSNNPIGGAFLGYFAYIMLTSSRTAPKRESLREALRQIPVTAAMQAAPQVIAGSMTLTDALDAHLREHATSLFPVVDAQGKVVGAIGMGSASVVGQSNPLAHVHEAMLPMERVRTIERDATLLMAIEAMHEVGWALVLDAGQLVGLVTIEGADKAFQQAQADLSADSSTDPSTP